MFYTSGQYVCPLIVDSGKAVERALSTDERAKLGILLISMDPARDDPEALMSVASKRKLDGARWSLASPAPDNVRGGAGVLGVRCRPLPGGEGNHKIDREPCRGREGKYVTIPAGDVALKN